MLLALLACHAPEPVETSTSPADTSNTDTSPPVDTAPVVLTAPVPAPEDMMREYSWNQFAGTALGRLGDDFVLTEPSHGWPSGDNLAYCWVEVLRSWAADESTGPGGIECLSSDGQFLINSKLGTQLVSPGDLTGDGQDDLVLFDGDLSYPLHDVPGFVFPGPIIGTLTIESPGVVALTALGLPRRGAPCGDLSADGKPDLCLDTGVAFGPITADSGLDVTWPAAGPSEHVRLLGWRGGLALWDDAEQALRWFEAISPGELDLGTGVPWTTTEAGHVDDLATGDLDADGADDLVVAWTDGQIAKLHVLTSAAGGALADAHASLTLPARAGRTSCNRPAEMCDPAALAVGDLDGDGQDDLVVGWGNEVRVFLGPIPAGELSTDRAVRWWTSPVTSQTFGHALLIHDADLDGSPELIVGDPDSYSAWDEQIMYGRVYVLEL